MDCSLSSVPVVLNFRSSVKNVRKTIKSLHDFYYTYVKHIKYMRRGRMKKYCDPHPLFLDLSFHLCTFPGKEVGSDHGNQPISWIYILIYTFPTDIYFTFHRSCSYTIPPSMYFFGSSSYCRWLWTLKVGNNLISIYSDSYEFPNLYILPFFREW